MKKFFTHFLALAACLGFSMNASAQFSATIESYPIDGWHGETHNFQLAEVASVLDVDAATLAAALDAWMEEEAPTEFLFQTANLVPTSLADYTANSRGFWMTAEGAVVEYAEGKMYSAFSWDAEAGTFSVTLGQTQSAWAVGEEGHCNLVLAYNGKKATFDMTLKVIEDPSAVNVQELDLTQLVVLMDAEVPLQQYQGSATKQEIDLTGVAAIIGITDEELAANLQNYIFTRQLELRGEDEDSQKPYMTNMLYNGWSANTGFWLAAVWDEENESFSNETARCIWGDHAAFRTMYSEQYSYDAETHKLSFVTGFENANLDLGTQFKFHIYFVNGALAYHITHEVTMVEKPYVDPSEFTKVGSEDVEMEFDYSATAYPGGVMSIDMDAVLALLECESSDIEVYYLQDSEGNLTTDHTANNGGAWFSEEGVVSSYGSGYFYAEPSTAGDYSTWTIGQYPGKNEQGAEFSTRILLANGTKYYAINLKVIIKEIDNSGNVDQDEWESVATWNLTATTQPTGDYPNVNLGGDYTVDEYPQIDLDALEEAIGTTTPSVFAWVQTEEGVEFTDAYSCTPEPGFWMDPDGYRSTWGSSCKVGFSYLSDGTFQLFQIPGGNALGSVWKTTAFLVNKKNGKYVTIKLTVIFGEAANYEDVGSADVLLPVANEDIDVDFSAAVEGLGIAGVSDVLGTNMRVVLDDGQWSELMGATDGAAININGGLDLSEGNADAVVYIYPMAGNDDNTLVLEVEKGSVALEAGQKVETKISFEFEAEDGTMKRYILNITLVDKETYDGIGEIGQLDNLQSDKAFDLSGRRSDMSRKGVYIVNGKKVVK